MRNEATNIRACLDSLLTQSHISEDFRILVIDDHSEDESTAIAATFAKNNPERVCLLHLPPGRVGKKAALAHGVKHCPDESILLTTDADCVSKQTWLAQILQTYDTSTQAVCGPVRLTGRSCFQQWQRLELAGFMTLTQGHILMHAPSLANGANFSFRKSAYTAVEGYRAQKNVASGDDMLLLHKIADHFGGTAVRFAGSRAAGVDTPAHTALRAFWRQRIRWVSKASAYTSLPTMLSQGLAYVANLWVILVLVMAILLPELWAVAVVGYALKAIGETAVLSYGSVRYGTARLLLWIPLLHPLQTLYTIALGPIGALHKSYRWKGRQTR